MQLLLVLAGWQAQWLLEQHATCLDHLDLVEMLAARQAVQLKEEIFVGLGLEELALLVGEKYCLLSTAVWPCSIFEPSQGLVSGQLIPHRVM